MKHKKCKLFSDCNIKLHQTQSIVEGLNTTTEVPFDFNDEWILKSNLKFIKKEPAQPAEKYFNFWEKCSIINIEFFNCRLYITALIETSDGKKDTRYFMVKNFLVGLYVYAKYKINITKVLAWVGGILSTILTIKEIFN